MEQVGREGEREQEDEREVDEGAGDELLRRTGGADSDGRRARRALRRALQQRGTRDPRRETEHIAAYSRRGKMRKARGATDEALAGARRTERRE